MVDEVSWTRVAGFPLERDLQPLLRELERRGIPCRLVVEGAEQVMWLTNERDMATVLALLQGEVETDLGGSSGAVAVSRVAGFAIRFPVVFLGLTLAVVGALVARWVPDWLHWLTFQDFVEVNGSMLGFISLNETYQRGEYWRVLTPTFLHFGLFHLVFNALWLWEFGRRLELVDGSRRFLTLFVILAVGANVGQYLWSGPSLFGGLSGVIYGLLGCIWIRQQRVPHPALALPRGIIVLMLVWLLLCLVGIVDFFIPGSIANGAHVAGLVVGLVWGGLTSIGGPRHT